MNARLTLFLLPLACAMLPVPATSQAAQPAAAPTTSADATATDAPDLSLLADMKARAIGPAVCSGRIGAVCGVPGNPNLVWAGAAAGGVWRSNDGGVTFEAVFDDQDVASIGAIAVHPHAPEVVWVGSGEGNPRNSASSGRGIYRTTDNGRTWQKLGLEKTERIHRIILHPNDPNTVWVAAFGTSWGENEQRGVFKTTDAGATWEKVLYVDERTGCSDLVIDPRNPNKLFASMWEHRRWPYSFKSGGPGSGLYRSLDGGSTWQRLDDSDGLPKGELGRIGLAISRSNPNVIYALTEAKKSVLLRSDDGGFRFRTVNDDDGIAPRPFYFCDLRVDPHDPERLYSMQTVIDVSTDGGRSFATLVDWGAAHPDHHSMWIDPTDPRRIVIGNDGGVYTSTDRGAHWRFCRNLPLAQFYHCAVDMEVPYNIYGGLQDNGSWRGPSTVWENGGIRNLHWQEVCFGDGFATLPDPDNSQQGYAMSQGGSLVRWDLRTGSRKFIQPPAFDDETELRFHWNAAIAIDPFDPATVFYGSQFVHKSSNRGGKWEVISPDLTTDNKEWQKQEESGGLTIDVTAAENHCTILTIAPSPVQQGILWVGTDDGRVQVSEDGGNSWNSVERYVPGLPKHTWCPHIEASKHDAKTAYAVFDGHRNADWTSYVYVTRNLGRTWTALAPDDIDGYCHVIEQDPVQADLLWVGTEFGLFVSTDAGAHWQKWTHGVPTTAVRALVTHPREHDLVIATHGRSLFVLDDITPLREMANEQLASKLHVYPPRPAIQHGVAQSPSTRFPGQGEFRGPTATRGLVLQLVATAEELAHPDPDVEKARKKEKESANDESADDDKPAKGEEEGGADDPDADDTDAEDEDSAKDGEEAPKDNITVEVRDADGQLVRTFRRKVHLGLNRIVWRFERDGVQGPSRSVTKPPKMPTGGRSVLPGGYELTVRFQDEERKVAASVLADPRAEYSMADRQAKDALRVKVEALTTRLHAASQRLAPIAARIAVVEKRLALEEKPKTGDDPFAAMRAALKTVQKARKAAEEKLWGKTRKVQGISRGNDGLVSKVRRAARVVNTPEAPTGTEIDGLARALAKVAKAEEVVETFLKGPLADFQKAVAASGMGLLPAASESATGAAKSSSEKAKDK
ncbi:MAG: hypothetical protein AB8H80_10825 [Planctomycetota bacterium]